MTTHNPYSSVLIGDESLLIQCAEVLLERGHSVLQVVSQNAAIKSWAQKRSIEIVAPGRDLAARLPDGFDWLLSIANLSVIPGEVLKKAKRGAINFHDGLLPRYAGLNAPNWALIHRESSHGVTWHLIEGGVDEGDILVQREFDVAPLSTALEINTQCYQAAIESFGELCDQLGNDALERTKQDLTQRTYFGKHDRPDALATIDWSQDAESIVALVRALDFGSYPNPLHIAKTLCKGSVYLVSQVSLAEDSPQGSGAPGAILAKHDHGVVVATGSAAVVVSKLADQNGDDVDLGRFQVGDAFASLDASARSKLSERNADLCKHDGFWARRLSRITALEWPFDAKDDTRTESYAHEASYARAEFERSSLSDHELFAGIGAWLSRVSGQTEFHVGFADDALAQAIGGDEPFFADVVPFRVRAVGTVADLVSDAEGELERVRRRVSYARDVVARHPDASHASFRVAFAPGRTHAVPGSLVTITDEALYLDERRLPASVISAASERLQVVLAQMKEALAAGGAAAVSSLSVLSAEERERMVVEWNRTEASFESACVHQLFEKQVAKTPDAVALVFEGDALTYAQLNEKANHVAHRLIKLGVTPDARVGLYVYRSLELVVGALAIQKAGGAYVPLDPEYPAERIQLMIEDSRAPVIVTHDEAKDGLGTLASGRKVLVLDEEAISDRETASRENPNVGVTPEHLAYVIYTSGSTGRPKGVMVEHRNVANFFAGMDERVPPASETSPGTWLAVTSLSFDISVLELFYTLARGFRVVVYRDRTQAAASSDVPAEVLQRSMDFSLFYWGNDDDQGGGKYQLLLDGARYADEHGFAAVWTPERHFHAFGGPFPNPAVTGAAVAAITKNVQVRAGSCVVPLHSPIRIAEEWAVVDNLSGGRVGLACASGWQPDDFVLRPENAPPNNKTAMIRDIEVIRKLWRGEAVEFERNEGARHAVVTQPRPMQSELPMWLTTAGNPQTYKDAGRLGLHVLTHLLGQSIDEVAEKIKIYRAALVEHGRDPSQYKVTLMLHTLLGEDREEVRAIAKQPMISYLKSAAALIKQYAWAFPAFKRPEGVTNPMQVDLQTLDQSEMDAILEFAFERYFNDSGLFGTPEDAVARVNQLKAIGVDEVACLVDYGAPVAEVMKSLTYVAQVVQRTSRPKVVQPAAGAEESQSFPAQIERHQVTHLQCTPSMARMLLMNHEARASLSHVQTMMLGGEALPTSLVSELEQVTKARVLNMYGPTETTIWSSTAQASPSPSSSGETPATSSEGVVGLGRPIANTQLYVLDSARQPVPVGVPGELYIGGDGVTRGYLDRPELTAERFVPDPFREGDHRLYRTGDLVRFRANGELDFLGRIDHQVKLRGYRIELGEIESRLTACAEVREAVVLAREDSPGDKRLVAYVTLHPDAEGETVEEQALRDRLAEGLPDYMVPSHVLVLEQFPLTPNAKVDRKALPRPDQVQKKSRAEYVAPENETEKVIAEVWRNVLGVSNVSTKDNFFELGGHSLLAVQAHRELRKALSANLSITDLYRFPTIAALVEFLGDGGSGAGLEQSLDRAAARRAALGRRRARAR